MLTLPRSGRRGSASSAAEVGRTVADGGARLTHLVGRWVASGAASSFVTVAGVTAFVVAELHPALLLGPSMDVGGDNAAHVVAVNYFIHHLINHGQLSGWDPQWFGGFPLYVFYFPLPPVLAAFFSLFVSYAVAFKLVSVLGSVLCPVAAFTFGRLAGLRAPIPALMSVGMLAFLFNNSYTIYGGNIVSTMAGEFSFSLAVSLALFFLGTFCYALRTGRLRWLAAILYALTMCSHVVPALFAGAAACLFALASWNRRARAARALARVELAEAPAAGRWRALRQKIRGRIPQPLQVLLTTGVVGGLLAAFWLVPFGAYLDYSASMGYTRVPGFTANFLPGPADDAIAALAVLAFTLAIARKDRVPIVLGVITGLDLLAFFFLPDGLIYNARWLPFFFLCICLLAAYGLGELGRLLLGATARVNWAGAITPIVLGLASLAVVAAYCGVLPGYSTPPRAEVDAPGWATFNYTGYQGKPGWPQFENLVAMLDKVTRTHGCGRLDYEYSGTNTNVTNEYGSTLVPMSFPLWTDGCVQVEEGVYYESSTSIYYHFLDQSELSLAPSNPVSGLPYAGLDVADGVRHLQLTGVKYFLASSPTVEQQAAADPDLVPLGSSPESPDVVDRTTSSPQPPSSSAYSYVLYEIRRSPIVTSLVNEPVVEHLSTLQWRSQTISWYQDESAWPVEIAAAGPSRWPVYAPGTVLPPSAAIHVRPTRVSHVVMGDQQISFHVARTGTPILVKIPYFPNWRATGAEGPYEVAPNLMAVLPTSHHVLLRYETTTIDWAGRIGSIVGLAGLAGIVGTVPPLRPPPEPARLDQPAGDDQPSPEDQPTEDQPTGDEPSGELEDPVGHSATGQT